ncbi:BEM_collapsed_G0059450.mRNA.1.CDS.1 [Saccharomyces cerevisiae]|nr:BEM_collapsed_G0059450.mRNA.1.CDS.1 [Saccharomyces cerevisiae]
MAAYEAASMSIRDNLVIDWNKTQQKFTTRDPKRVYYLSLEFLMGRALDNALINMKIEDPEDPAASKGKPREMIKGALDDLGFKLEGCLGPRTGRRPEGGKTTLSASQWIGGERVLAVAYDFPVPGFKTSNVNNLRLWQARPTTEFDFAKFNNGDYKNSVAQQQRAESITAVLYPNDNFAQGKELRLKQQYFWCAASLHDILRRFKKSKRPWTEFPDQVAIQLNDTHPTLAIVELQRVLVDLEKLDWHEAWDIVTKTFAYTNHTVMQEALEKWPKTLQKDRSEWPFLAIVGSHKVNGVAELHSELIKTTIFKDFVKFYGPSKFVNVTNGITPRRWLKQANPSLAKLISETLNDPTEEYLLDMAKLTQLGKYVEDREFLKKWNQVKLNNKIRLVDLIKKENDGVDIINREYLDDTLFDMQVKRIHEYKRQQLNVFGIIYRYLAMKNMLKNGASIEEVAKKYPRKVSIFGGKSAPGYYMAKLNHKIDQLCC